MPYFQYYIMSNPSKTPISASSDEPDAKRMRLDLAHENPISASSDEPEPDAKRMRLDLAAEVQSSLTPNQSYDKILSLFATHGADAILEHMTEQQLRAPKLFCKICSVHHQVFNHLNAGFKCELILLASRYAIFNDLLNYIAGKEDEDAIVYATLFSIPRSNVIRQTIIANDCFQQPERIAAIISAIGNRANLQFAAVFIVENFIRHAVLGNPWKRIFFSHWCNIANVNNFYDIRNYKDYIALLLMVNYLRQQQGMNVNDVEVMNKVERATNLLRLNTLPSMIVPTKYLFCTATDLELISYLSRRTNEKNQVVFSSLNIYERVWSQELLASLQPEWYVDRLKHVKLDNACTMDDLHAIEWTPKRILDICKNNPFLYHTMDDEMKQTPKLFERVVPYEFEHMPDSAKNNKQTCLSLLTKSVSKGKILHMSPEMQLEMDVFTDAMRGGSRRFKHLDERVRASPLHAMIALRFYPNNAKHTPLGTNQFFLLKVLLSMESVTEHYFKVLTANIRQPIRRLIKFSRVNGFSFNKTHKVPKQLDGAYDFTMNTEKSVYMFMHCLKRLYPVGGKKFPFYSFINIFRDHKLMEYLD